MFSPVGCNSFLSKIGEFLGSFPCSLMLLILNLGYFLLLNVCFSACCFQNIAEKCQAVSQFIWPPIHLVLIHLGSSLHQKHLYSTLISLFFILYISSSIISYLPQTSDLTLFTQEMALVWFFIDLSRLSDVCTLRDFPSHVNFSLHLHPLSRSGLFDKKCYFILRASFPLGLSVNLSASIFTMLGKLSSFACSVSLFSQNSSLRLKK